MSTDERRAPGAARIPFDALVEVGGALGPSFEAQAINVSEEGMQIRTAYLPELGQQVTCRFETPAAQSIIASGDVVWSRGAEQGGEFGIRFTELDPESVGVLKRLCGFDGGEPGHSQAGSKVRLYIDGLASPMRAKIRDAQPTAITVGSELGFLQVGKHLELEDAQSGRKRAASIDRVEVAVDPDSHVPQLVVTLRYTDAPARERPTSARAPEASGEATVPRKEARLPEDLAPLDGPSANVRGAFARQAARVGPLLERYTQRVKATLSLLAQRRRQEDDPAPRRTTAPAPGGGLHANGRRVVRGEAGLPGADEGAHRVKTTPRRRAAVAAAVMTAAVAGAIVLKKVHHDAGPPGPVAVTAIPDAAPLSSSAASPTPGTAQASATVAASSAPPETAPPAAASSTSAASAESSNDESSNKLAHAAHTRPAPFGNGPVHHGNVLRLRMDGPIDAIQGAEQPAGFTVRLPGRKSLDAAGPLAARDARIAAIKVTNQANGAELTVAFRDGVPNYQVGARGDTLVISIAPAGALEKTVAKREDKNERAAKHGKRARDMAPPEATSHSRTQDTTPER